jgi:hypothetical protein
MRIIRASIFVSVAVVMLVAIYVCAARGSQGTAASDQVPTVTYCELMKNPKRYHDKVVRVNALFARDFEVSSLYDQEDCTKGKPDYASLSSTWVGYDKTFVMDGDSDEAKNNQKVSGFGRWSITAVGRFRRAEDPHRFGHLACCKYSFALMKIENSEKLR